MTTKARRVPMPPHGTPSRYFGTPTGSRPPCSCRLCVDAHSRACRERELATLNGTPPRVPTGPIADHIHALLTAGMSRTQIAIAAGVSRSAVANAAKTKTPMTNRRTARLILAVRPRIVRDTDRLPIVGTRRRIQALYSIGHGAKVISELTGMSPYAIQIIANRQQDVVTAATYKKIRAAYRALAVRPGTSLRAKASARTHGWLPPVAWGEDIDRPDAQPNLDDTSEQLNRNELGALRRAEIEHLAAFNVPEHEIAARLGMATAYVHDIARELRTGQQRDRTNAGQEVAA